MEYKCWHEVGRVTVCLHLGGEVEFVQLLDGDTRGHERARCLVMPEMHRSVACGGFAAEFYLLNNGYAHQGRDDDMDISRIVFHNATHARQDFWEREPGSDQEFSETEDKEFMRHAIGPDCHGGMIPIFNLYFSRVEDLVRELGEVRRVKGERI